MPEIRDQAELDRARVQLEQDKLNFERSLRKLVLRHCAAGAARL
jgi:hypothetical protein